MSICVTWTTSEIQAALEILQSIHDSILLEKPKLTSYVVEHRRVL